MGRWWAALPRALPPAVIVLPVALVQTAVTAAAAHQQDELRPLDALGVALLVTGPLILVLRRRFPVPTVIATLAVTLLYYGLGYPLGPAFLAFVIALFTVVLRGHRVVGWTVAALGLAGFVVVQRSIRDGLPNVPQVLGIAAWLVVVVVIAEIAGARRERAAQAERARAEHARRMLSDERLRIAREVHDVLAHHVSLINVQSGVALHLMDADPEQARTALAVIKQSSKEILVDLRGILGVLRGVDRDLGAPAPPAVGLDDLDDLLVRMRTVGLPVELRTEGERRSLPRGVDTAALRIVQESLTNTYRHAGPARAVVHLIYLPERLRVRVEDNGRGGRATAFTEGGGNGLAGMRQRTEALDGTFHAGPLPGGGFRVVADLPVEPAARHADDEREEPTR